EQPPTPEPIEGVDWVMVCGADGAQKVLYLPQEDCHGCKSCQS
ncbi:hypothetical protein LCGC14_2741320, partial [marine sediment metagenome]